MILRRINIYPEFHCLADACEDTCCSGWQIVIDRKSLRHYRYYWGKYRKILKQRVDWKNKVFRQEANGDCAFLKENGLCDMILQIGEKQLCRTCRRFPRHIEEFENVRELTLSMSCPEVARLLLWRTKKVYFQEKEVKGEDSFEGFDPFLYSLLQDVREMVLKIYTNRHISMEKRIQFVDDLIEMLQEKIDAGQLFSCNDVLEEANRYWTIQTNQDEEPDQSETSGMDQEETDSMQTTFEKSRKQFEKLFRLEILKEAWQNLLLEADMILYGSKADHYYELKQKFEAWKKEQSYSFDIMKEQLLVYFTMTYFCGAVYDEDLTGKLALIRNSVFWLEELFLASWCRNKEELMQEEIEEIVYRFCRELEHSDENLRAVEKMGTGKF